MSKFTSSQKDVKQRRSSRVEITHEVHLPGDAKKQETLPLVIGVMADLSGDTLAPKVPLRDADRDFVRVHLENFDEVLAGVKPRVAYDVENSLAGEGQLKVELEFRRLDDFHPDSVASRVPEIRDQLRTRKLLEELRNMISSDPHLQEQLEEIVSDPAKRGQFLQEMNRRRAAGRTVEGSR